jgi:hypothetical protein
MDELLDSLIDLELASLEIPTGIDFKFNALDDAFSQLSEAAASLTHSLCQSLAS